MFSSFRKVHVIFGVGNNALVDYPTPLNLSSWWNFGSLLGFCLIVQVLAGLFLSMHYVASVDLAFYSVVCLARDVNFGWFIRFIHANGASLFFIFMYLHIGRGLYYGSYSSVSGWSIGVFLFLLTMVTAFLGYVLPWGQMSFWGATVITNFLSAVPYIGGMLVEWVWGGFSVDNATLVRFYAFHFLFPFMILGLSFIHLVFLHEVGANNPLGINSFGDNISFHPYFIFKDMFGFFLVLFFFMSFVFFFPNSLVDPENFVMANSLVTPVHIQPEWYFLFAYAILRAVPNKLGGVVALLISVLILFVVPFLFSSLFRGEVFYPFGQVFFWYFIMVFILLTWIGSCPVEFPYDVCGCFFTFLYFLYFMISIFIRGLWDFFLM
uniref:Cytochrome b n=1 Tax=Nectonemertes cf. mirabilis HC-2011 TaxID=992350 RepID=I1SR44_9BILA|nr:cytochrome b [Nectonemertes cf. mirabilis HC-2011]ADZ05364.1 cytochrome b [Nectonemertes cf. mirabilis HC-2011]